LKPIKEVSGHKVEISRQIPLQGAQANSALWEISLSSGVKGDASFKYRLQRHVLKYVTPQIITVKNVHYKRTVYLCIFITSKQAINCFYKYY
jgi:hypothetical protein